MARIQHKYIPDAELHEVKGANSAITGSVLVADGAGSTAFQKIGISSLAGALPTGVAGLPVGTDGMGGFQSLNPSYGQFRTTRTGTTNNPNFTTEALINPVGMTLLGSGVNVAESGLYWYGVDGFNLTYAEGGSLVTGIGYKSLVNATAGRAIVTTALSGIVQLTAGVQYHIDQTGGFSLWKINV